MRRTVRVGVVAILGMAAFSTVALYHSSRPAWSQGAPDVTADLVLGQTNFHTNTAAVGQAALSDPRRIAIDTSVTPNHLYVVDHGNNRILGWSDAASLSNGEDADLEIGQTDFNGNQPNGGGAVSATTFTGAGASVDSQGNLYLADGPNNRVLEYNTPYTRFGHSCIRSNPCMGLAANLVFGQGSDGTAPVAFTTSSAGTSATAMEDPNDTATDSQGNLYVADHNNHRVLIFFDPLDTSAPCAHPGQPGCAGDVIADVVLGQGSSPTNFGGNAKGTGPTGMAGALSVRVDSNHNLYVSDEGNNRVLMFLAPLDTSAPCATPGNPGCAGDVIADAVFGQGAAGNDFSTSSAGVGATEMSAPLGLSLDSFNNFSVADSANNRVIEFNEPEPGPPNNFTANVVYGQGSSGTGAELTTNVCADGKGADPAPSATGMCTTRAVAFDSDNRVYVSDAGNNRVLVFNPLEPPAPTATPTATSTAASPTATPTATATPTSTPTPEAGTLTFKPNPLAFGSKTTVGKTSKASKVTIKNTSSKSSRISVTIAGETSAAPFAVTSQCTTTLVPGKSCKVLVTFTPPDTSLHNGNLIVNDSALSDPQMVPLSGTGKAPK